jgi:hypothetical protein
MADMKMQMYFQTGGDEAVMDEAAQKKVEAYVASRVGGMRCPDHDKQPTIVCRGDRLDALSFEVEGCCQKIVYLVKEKLSA